MLRVTAPGCSTWEGELADLLQQNPEIPVFCRRRLETLEPGESVQFKFDGPHLFTFLALTDDQQNADDTGPDPLDAMWDAVLNGPFDGDPADLFPF